jgi:hypothetical protein
MTNQHPITPQPELVEQWHDECHKVREPFLLHIANQAARWGADQELEACCEWLDRNNQWAQVDIDELRDARRPKPPTLKEQALDDLTAAERLYPADWSSIRRALEALPND